MRIAYLSQSYPPMVSGASLAVQMLAEGMAKRGHDVLVLTSSDLGVQYSQQKDALKVHFNRSSLNPLRVGQRYTKWSHRTNMKLLCDFRPNIIHTHDPFQFAFSGFVYCKKANVPITITTHQLPWFVKSYLPDGSMLGGIIEGSLWGYSTLLLRRFDTVISPTTTIANVINQKTGIVARVINYGIELDCFQKVKDNSAANGEMRRRLNIPPGVPVVLHVGRLDVDKNVEIVVRAAAKTLENNKAHLLIVGDGTEKLKLMKLCKDIGIGERSHFPGYITSRSCLADVYRMANVFVTASEIETQGIVLLEAAACGLPIVAVDATCIPEVVRDGENGYLTEPRNVDNMAQRLGQILADSNMAKNMGQVGHVISQKFSKQRTIVLHEDLYIQMILRSKYFSQVVQKPLEELRFRQL